VAVAAVGPDRRVKKVEAARVPLMPTGASPSAVRRRNTRI
jgi:hypothetical protein